MKKASKRKVPKPRFVVETKQGTTEIGRSVSYELERVRCNKPKCRRCRGSNAPHGPYWYAYWRVGPRVRKRYVGKVFRDLTELELGGKRVLGNGAIASSSTALPKTHRSGGGRWRPSAGSDAIYDARDGHYRVKVRALRGQKVLVKASHRPERWVRIEQLKKDPS